MRKRVLCFLLVGSGALVSYCGANKDVFKGAFGYEILEHQIDHLYLNLETLTKQMTHVQDKSEIVLERLLAEISSIANTSNKILQNQAKQPRSEINSCLNAVNSGIYQLKLSTKSPLISVYCDVESFLGGWLVIQQRTDGSVNFTRTWQEYQDGFGTVGESSEFWLGLDFLHLITSSDDFELLIELVNEAGKYGFARYKDFRIAGEGEKYRMSSLGEYTGTIGDWLRPHQNSQFSTFDNDNDLREGSCSLIYHSGAAWWFNNCGGSSLNGPYNENKEGYAIFWLDWCKAATFSRMMIRLKDHNHVRFSTFDQDNDDMKGDICARKYFSGGGWWYSSCAYSSLNGQFTKNKEEYGINWFDWSKAASFSRMMIRRK